LGHERIRPDENFFELGGSSLLAIKVIAAVNGACGCDLPVTSIFQGSTVRTLAALIAPAPQLDEAATVHDQSRRDWERKERRRRGVNDPHYVKAGADLGDVTGFDAAFFNYSPREAEIMDPQHRLFLECAWEALEYAACDPERTAGPIGMYAAVSQSSYLLKNLM